MNNFPALFFQSFYCFYIIGLIGIYFIYPPRSSCFGYNKIFAFIISMPEAAMNKDDGFAFREYYIRFAGQFFIVQFIPKPFACKNLRTSNSGFVLPLRMRLRL